jgi:hypothetical protein
MEMQIVSDPRTTIPQTLQAILSAELADNDGWQMLGKLAGQLRFPKLVTKCEKAFEEEQEHVENVRGWLSEMTLSEAAQTLDPTTTQKRKGGSLSDRNARSNPVHPKGQKKSGVNPLRNEANNPNVGEQR